MVLLEQACVDVRNLNKIKIFNRSALLNLRGGVTLGCFIYAHLQRVGPNAALRCLHF